MRGKQFPVVVHCDSGVSQKRRCCCVPRRSEHDHGTSAGTVRRASKEPPYASLCRRSLVAGVSPVSRGTLPRLSEVIVISVSSM